MSTTTDRLRAVTLTVVGWVLVAVGVVLFPLPGPGLLLIFVGLAVLAEQYEWAERRVDRVKAQAVQSATRGVRTPAHAAVSVLLTSALAASGLLWVWAPPQPSWWVLPAWTWLPGGLWTGLGQVGSGLLTLGLVIWAWRRHHAGADVETPGVGRV